MGDRIRAMAGSLDELIAGEKDDEVFRTEAHIKAKTDMLAQFSEHIVAWRSDLRFQATMPLERRAHKLAEEMSERAQTDLNNDRDMASACRTLSLLKDMLCMIDNGFVPDAKLTLQTITEVLASFNEASAAKRLETALVAFKAAPDLEKLDFLASAYTKNQTNNSIAVRETLVAVWPEGLRLVIKSAVAGSDVKPGTEFLKAALKDDMVAANVGGKCAVDDFKVVETMIQLKCDLLASRDDLSRCFNGGDRTGGIAFTTCMALAEKFQRAMDDLQPLSAQPFKDCNKEFGMLTEALTHIKANLGDEAKEACMDRARLQLVKLNCEKGLLMQISGGCTSGKSWYSTFDLKKNNTNEKKIDYVKDAISKVVPSKLEDKLGTAVKVDSQFPNSPTA